MRNIRDKKWTFREHDGSVYNTYIPAWIPLHTAAKIILNGYINSTYGDKGSANVRVSGDIIGDNGEYARVTAQAEICMVSYVNIGRMDMTIPADE